MKNIRVCTYNILHGKMVEDHIGTIGKDIVEMGAEIAGIQEVDMGTSRVKDKNSLAEIAKGAGYEYYCFAKAIDYRGGEYGTAILSKYPIISYEVIPLIAEGIEGRSLCHAVIDINGFNLDFFNTHTSYESKDTRKKQLLQIAAETAKCEHFVLTGDFNTADFTEFEVIANSKLLNNGQYLSFYPAPSAIDNIVVSNNISFGDSGMPETKHSDHYPIFTDIKIEL
jgi:endonuclease/exonuclease/phosphatase family metal-dependent hydrolase